MSRTRQRQTGFTLIEMMIVVALIAILATIAVPSYRAYVMRGKVAQAFGQLGGLGITLQQYYQDNRSFVGACAAGTSAPLPTVNTGDFTYTCPTLTATGFVAQASGNAGTMVAGFVYTLDQNGARATTATGTSGWPTSATCWIRDASGACN